MPARDVWKSNKRPEAVFAWGTHGQPSFFGFILLRSVTGRHDPFASKVYTACSDCGTQSRYKDDVPRQMLPTGLQNQGHRSTRAC